MAFLDDLDTPCPFIISPQVLLSITAIVLLALYSDLISAVSNALCALATGTAILAVVLIIVGAMDLLISYLAN
jgi:hypothetical protein